MKKVLLVALAAMLLCSGCMEMLMLTCDPDTDDCSFAGKATPPAPLSTPPTETAR